MIRVPDHRMIRESDLKEASNFEGIETCAEGKIKAKEDLGNGRYRQIVGSYGIRQPYVKVLEEKYDVEIIEVDGLLGIPNSCYNDVMHRALQEKHGQLYLNEIMESN